MSKASYEIRSNLTAVIDRTGENVTVEIHAPLHVNKIVTVPHCYSLAFSNSEILRDSHFRKFIDSRYGADNK